MVSGLRTKSTEAGGLLYIKNRILMSIFAKILSEHNHNTVSHVKIAKSIELSEHCETVCAGHSKRDEQKYRPCNT